MQNINMVTDKDKEKIKQGYMDMHKNIEKFLFLKGKNYDFKNIDLKDIKRVTKNGSHAIYEYNNIYFEVSACLSKDYYINPGYYMSYDNIMGNWYGVNGSGLTDTMFKGYSSPKIAVKNYIKGLDNIIKVHGR